MNNQVIQQFGDILIFNLYEEKTHARIRYYLNLKEYELLISGEISASYKWVANTKESFIDLMLRSDYGYLLMKLGYSRPKNFDLDKSIEKTIKNIKENFEEDIELNLEGDDLEDFYSEIRNGIECYTSERFITIVNEIIDSYEGLYGLDLHECIECVEDHPYWLKKSVEYFCEHIKPLLKEVLGNE